MIISNQSVFFYILTIECVLFSFGYDPNSLYVLYYKIII